MKKINGIWTPRSFSKSLQLVSMALEGKVQCSVIDSKTKQVIRTYPEQKNLILNQGMNNFATVDLANLFLYAVVGSGTTPTSDDSGVTTASQSGATVTLAGGAFTFTNTATDAGKMIKWDAGSEARIVTVTDSTHAVVSVSQSVTAGQFTVYRTNQTGLTTELKRSNTYLTGAGNCGVSYDDVTGKISGFRTYDFAAEVGVVSYTELGVSNLAAVASNLNARILLAAAVALGTGQQLRIKYTLSITQTPAVTAAVIAVTPIVGWLTATGTSKIQHHGLSYPSESTGLTVFDQAGGVDSFGLEPNRVVQINTNSSSAVHSAWRSVNALVADIETKNCTVEAYTALNFYRDKSISLALAESISSSIRSIYISSNNNNIPTFRYLINSNQSKDALHTLIFVFRLTWGRILA